MSDEGYDGFAGSPVGDDAVYGCLMAPLWGVRWLWRKVRGK